MIGNIHVTTIQRLFIILELIGIFLLLLIAFGYQIVLHELPCPLCFLQRLGFLGAALGLLMNLRFGLFPSHYAVSLLSALFTGFVALRQIALHVVSGGATTSPVLGLHLYTWSFIISMVIVVYTTAMMSVDIQYHHGEVKNKFSKTLMHILFAIAVVLVVANLIDVLFICGISECPDDPVRYYNLFRWAR